MVELCLKARHYGERPSSAQKLKFLKVILGAFAVVTVANAQTASLTLGSGAGTPAGNVTVKLTLVAGGTQLAALQWTLQYSPTDISGGYGGNRCSGECRG